MIRAKLVLRNVISKPLRTCIIILSLAAAAFAALFCIAGIQTAKNDLRDFFHSNYGDVDVLGMGNNIEVSIDDLPPGSRMICEAIGNTSLTIPNSRYVNYINKLNILIDGIDTKLAYELHMIENPCPTEDGLTMTEPLAALLDKKVGDTFTFYGDGDKEYNLKILSIVPATKYLNSKQNAIIVTPDLCNEISGVKKGTFDMFYADIPDDQVAGAIDSLYEKYPSYGFMGTTSNDSNDTMNSMLNVYYLIFAVVFLMVCFIVVSMSKHIVNERMSVIGMLRSIGGSIAGTGMMLLCESIFYGLCGGILGTLIYLPMRGNTSLSLFMVLGEEDMSHSDGITIWTMLLVILGVTLIQCLFSAAAIFKAAKTPVRDIIFGTKDTAYIPSVGVSVAGAVLLAAGIVINFVTEDFIMTVVAAFLTMVGAVMLFPMVLSWITKLLSAMFTRLKNPVAKLAAKEISSTKSSVSSAQLLLSAMSLTLSMLVISVSLLSFLANPVYNCNVLITEPEQSGSDYDYVLGSINGVQDVEKIYYKYLQYESRAEINGEVRDFSLLALNDTEYRYFNGISGCPESLADDEMAIDKIIASKLGIHVGDTVKLVLKIESYLPRELDLRVKSIIDAGYFNNYGNTVMVNLKNYKSVYYDEPYSVLIKTEPGMEYSVMDMMLSVLSDSPSSIMTQEDYNNMQRSYMDSILSVVYAVILLGFVLSLLGTFSNMLMGFEHSRRKYAVYYSSSMSKSKLKKLMIWETVLTSGISVIISVLFGLFFLTLLNKALSLLNMSIPLVHPVLYALLFGATAFAVLLVVVIKPIRMLSKMNIAEEIKTSAD